MTDVNPRAVLGGNRPPAEEEIELIRERLEEFTTGLRARHPELWRDLGGLELDGALLPTEVKSDDDVAEITAHVVKLKGLARRFGETQKAEKAPILAAGRAIDEATLRQADALETAWKLIERRCGPYLKAKAEAAEAKRREAARAAQAAAEEAQRRARAEQEERDRKAQEAARAAQAVRTATTDEGRQIAAEQYREAEQGRALAHEAAEQASADVASATRYAETQERVADRGGLGLTATESGSANIKPVEELEINFPVLRASLAPLGSYFPDDHLRAAVQKAHRLGVRDIPGVTVNSDYQVTTRARRK